MHRSLVSSTVFSVMAEAAMMASGNFRHGTNLTSHHKTPLEST